MISQSVNTLLKCLKTYIRKILRVLCRIGYYISYVWFLIPFVFYYGIKGAWVNMQTSPKLTDFYLGFGLWSLVLFLVAFVFLVYRRRIIQICLAVVVGILLLLVTAFTGIALASAPTSFGEDHPIPEGLTYYMPKLESEDLEEGVCSSDSTTFLQLKRSFQGGIYEYSFFYPSLPEGTIWLECYEVTENLPLSKSEIKKKSTQEVKGTKHFDCLVKEKSFTIYEGDWGDCYAARIEVWFKDKEGKKRKLFEKIYGVEGWMR